MFLDVGEVLVFLLEVAGVDGGVVVDVRGLGGADGAAERFDVARVFPVAAGCCGWFVLGAVDLLGGR